MVLIDTSVWIDHFRRGDELLTYLLEQSQVVLHPWVIGELACGNLAQREQTIGLLQNLCVQKIAQDNEVLFLIAQHGLFGLGIGYVDAQLLASCRLFGYTLLTRDKRLLAAAQNLGLAYQAKLH